MRCQPRPHFAASLKVKFLWLPTSIPHRSNAKATKVESAFFLHKFPQIYLPRWLPLKGIMMNVVRLKYYSFCRSGIFFNEKTNRAEIYINSRFHSKPKITKARPNKGSNKYNETSAEKEMITHVLHRKFRNNRLLKN